MKKFSNLEAVPPIPDKELEQLKERAKRENPNYEISNITTLHGDYYGSLATQETVIAMTANTENVLKIFIPIPTRIFDNNIVEQINIQETIMVSKDSRFVQKSDCQNSVVNNEATIKCDLINVTKNNFNVIDAGAYNIFIILGESIIQVNCVDQDMIVAKGFLVLIVGKHCEVAQKQILHKRNLGQLEQATKNYLTLYNKDLSPKIELKQSDDELEIIISVSVIGSVLIAIIGVIMRHCTKHSKLEKKVVRLMKLSCPSKKDLKSSLKQKDRNQLIPRRVDFLEVTEC